MRARSESSAASMDSLLDTMTNVVGILVILLVVTQLSVSSAVKRIQGEMDKISVEQLDEVLVSHKKQQEQLGKLQSEWRILDKGVGSDSVKNLNEEIAALQKKMAGQKVDASAQKKITQLQAATTAADKTISDEAKKIASLKKQIEEAQKKLDSMPPVKNAPSVVIRIPNPRAAPAGAKAVYFVCKNNTIIGLDEKALDAMSKTLRTRAERVKKSMKSDASTPDEFIYDGQKLEAYFAKQPSNMGGHKVKLWSPEWINRTLIQMEIGKSGETVSQLRQAYSPVRRKLKALKQNNQYARFVVYPDSFGVYLLARGITEKEGVPAGWYPHTSPEFNVHGYYIPGIKTKVVKPKDPPKPGSKPAPPKKPELNLD